MNEDMPWVIGLTDEEVQEIRTKKHELTEYGKQKIKQLMMNQEPYPDAMFEEAARREKENQVLEIAKNFMEENKEAFQHLAAIERKELAEKSFDELTKDQRIQLALEEVDWIVIGGQDGQEFYGSIQFLRKVLRSLK
jgi:glycine cleavage system pyridoxal-binding protein P